MVFDPQQETVRLNEAEARARRKRSLAIGAVLVVLVVLFYVVTLFKIAG
ncbi:protoheme IX farnesyltransferase [Aureimonas sp. ME7]|nr:protoheme IX farnesyltransferase [Aureimonas sp. ME7]